MSGAPGEREAILDRYRRLREAVVRHHSAMVDDFVTRDAVLEHARRLGVARGRHLTAERDQDLIFAFDLAIYTSPPGRSRAIDRYRTSGRLAPGSEDAALVDAMARGRFSLWRVERPHETAGLVMRDLIREEAEVWLVDEGWSGPPLRGPPSPPGCASRARSGSPAAPWSRWTAASWRRRS